jgi:hypothetical protein
MASAYKLEKRGRPIWRPQVLLFELKRASSFRSRLRAATQGLQKCLRQSLCLICTALAFVSRLRPIEPSDSPPAEQILEDFDRLERAMRKEGYRGCPFMNAVAELADPTRAAHKISVAQKPPRGGLSELKTNNFQIKLKVANINCIDGAPFMRSVEPFSHLCYVLNLHELFIANCL